MDIFKYFQRTIDKKASDLHLVVGCYPSIRVVGELEKIDDKIIEEKALEDAFFPLVSQKDMKKFKENLEVDFALNILGSRFRINLHYQEEGKIGIAARLIEEFIPRPEELNFDEILYKLTHLKDGLILVVGPTGSGKSTTMAAMIDIINQERRSHIITIEDPIEYIIKERQSIIEQRELGQDTKSFASALKFALRQDPNVIMVGEMRDLETIAAALIAAETGHLVISTLHTSTAAETIQRIVDVYPEAQQRQILGTLASVLRAVVAQQILPTVDRKNIVAREILINTKAVANLIRTNKIAQIDNVIETSRKDGMISMNKAIENLYKQGRISEDVAHNRTRSSDSSSAFY